jgi:hypothetical protein
MRTPDRAPRSITCHSANPVPLLAQSFADLRFNRRNIGPKKNQNGGISFRRPETRLKVRLQLLHQTMASLNDARAVRHLGGTLEARAHRDHPRRLTPQN